jgi:hypothetical protein
MKGVNGMVQGKGKVNTHQHGVWSFGILVLS